MRKIIAIVLAVVMIAAMSIPAFAANLEADGAEGEVIVKYEASKGFLVTIPEKIDLHDDGANGDTAANDSIAGGTGVVTIEKAKLNSGEVLTVTVASANSWELVDSEGADNIKYSAVVANTLNNGSVTGAITADTNTVIKYTSAAAGIDESNKPTSTMTFTTEFSNQAGTFTDTLTFTVAVD